MKTKEAVPFDKNKWQLDYATSKANIYPKPKAQHILYWSMGVTIMMLLAACTLFPFGIAKELPAEPIPTPTICTPLPATMTFQVIPLSHTSLSIVMTGLQPEEIPVVIVEAQTRDGSYRQELTYAQPVDASGQYNWDVSGLELSSPGTVPPPKWVVLVRHAQGVACTTIILP
jgi:hypothetical protein